MNKNVIAGIMGAIAGAGLAWGIMGTVDSVGVGRCIGTFETCGPEPIHLVAMIGAPILFIAAGFVGRLAPWLTGPIAGLATAGYLASQDEGGLSSSDLGMGAFIAFCVLLGPAILVVMRGRARAKAELAAHLVETGKKGVARVQGAQQTGVYINERPQLQVSYMIQPLDGTPAFAHTKKQLVDYGGIQPQPGLAWPCWYDPADPEKVAIGAPNGYTQETLQLLQEFGIPVQQAFGYDPSGGVTIPDPQSTTPPPIG